MRCGPSAKEHIASRIAVITPEYFSRLTLMNLTMHICKNRNFIEKKTKRKSTQHTHTPPSSPSSHHIVHTSPIKTHLYITIAATSQRLRRIFQSSSFVLSLSMASGARQFFIVSIIFLVKFGFLLLSLQPRVIAQHILQSNLQSREPEAASGGFTPLRSV